MLLKRNCGAPLLGLAKYIYILELIWLIPWEKGWRSGGSTRLPANVVRVSFPDSHHMWVEFVVGSRPCSERFFSGYSGFFLSSKTKISKFQFDLESVFNKYSALNALTLKFIYLFIYLFIYF